ATEAGPLEPAWKALLTEQPDRFLAGIDVWAPQLFKPETLDRLMGFYRRVLGELPPEAAAKIAHENAVKLFRLK
ncbi:MAG: amidohydrolase, partial [Candidatus Rokubacteria bacterium]|nr:amidohydrolase [Candidatus Rokubacteria bacterium]